MTVPGAPARPALFSERLWPGVGAWAIVPLGAVSVAFVCAPFGTVPAVIGFVLMAVMLVTALLLASPRLEVRDGWLLAGRARVETNLLGEAVGFRGEQARQERGPRLDARAFLLVRGWVDPVVRVRLEDQEDPTPYWLLSTRRPDELVAALARQ